MNFKTLCTLTILTFMTQCKTQNSDSRIPENDTVTIGLGESFTLPNQNIVEFLKIAEDSRCPIDATCVWEGIAVVDLKISKAGKTQNLKLATKDFEPKQTKTTLEIEDYIIKMIDVIPQPGSKKVEPALTFQYEKAKKED